jgi:hypothetical protein
VTDASLGEFLYELMRGGRFTLLDRSDNDRVARSAEEGWSGRAGIVRALTAATSDLPAVLLVRPDGYAAWTDDASAPGEQLPAGRALLRHWCGSAIMDRERSQRHGTL